MSPRLARRHDLALERPLGLSGRGSSRREAPDASGPQLVETGAIEIQSNSYHLTFYSTRIYIYKGYILYIRCKENGDMTIDFR